MARCCCNDLHAGAGRRSRRPVFTTRLSEEPRRRWCRRHAGRRGEPVRACWTSPASMLREVALDECRAGSVRLVAGFDARNADGAPLDACSPRRWPRISGCRDRSTPARRAAELRSTSTLLSPRAVDTETASPRSRPATIWPAGSRRCRPTCSTPGAYRRALQTLARQPRLAIRRFYDEAALRRLGAGAFLAVAQGSARRDAGIVHLRYRPRARARARWRWSARASASIRAAST